MQHVSVLARSVYLYLVLLINEGFVHSNFVKLIRNKIGPSIFRNYPYLLVYSRNRNTRIYVHERTMNLEASIHNFLKHPRNTMNVQCTDYTDPL